MTTDGAESSISLRSRVSDGPLSSTVATPPVNDVLLQTKLYVPPLHGAVLARPRLLALLDAVAPAALTLLSAPAGFGKTTLVAQWVHQHAPSVTWLSLDSGDNDPVRYWRHVIAALQQVDRRIGKTAAVTLQTPQPPPLESLVSGIINDLANLAPAARVTLVLDDYHQIHNNVVHGSMHFLLTHQPSNLHLILLTRADPPLSLARLRVQGRLTEVRAADLRFTDEETADLLRRVWRFPLGDGELNVLTTRTEGWPAGVQLAALALPRGATADLRRAVQAFAGNQRLVMEYLIDEVLTQQPDDVQHFLLHTAILERLTSPLCDALLREENGRATPAPNSRQILHDLEDANLFLVPLDDERKWYRYHPLLAEALRHRLARFPDALPPATLHRRAARWLAGAGLMTEAMGHALAADAHLAAHLIEAHYRTAVLHGELMSLRQWLEALPPALHQERPRLRLATAWAYAHTLRQEAFLALLTSVETAVADAPSPESQRLRGEAAALKAVFISLHDQPAQTVALAEQALAFIPEDDALLRAVTYQALGNAHRIQGQVRAARDAYATTQRCFQSLDRPLLALVPLARLGQVQALQGELHEAARTFAEVLRLAGDEAGESYLLAGETWAHLAELHREWNDLDQAHACALRELALVEQAGNVTALLAGYLTLARVESVRGAHDAALAALAHAEVLARDHDLSSAPHVVATHKARLSLAMGQVSEAVHWAATYEAQLETGATWPLLRREFADLTWARVRLAQRRPREAEMVLSRVRDQAERDGRRPAVIEALLLQGLAALAQGATERAVHAVAEAVALAADEGYVRLFVDEGRPMHYLLQQVSLTVRDEPQARTLARLRAAFGKPAAADIPAVFMEPLTPRELEILQLMATGATNQQIADQLVIGLGTVKGHINHILGKLDAQNRTEAVVRARALEILPD